MAPHLSSERQKLLEWHKEHADALLEDMQLFLRTQCGLEVSLPTISRKIRKAYGGTLLRSGRCARIRSRRQREAEGRSIALELQQQGCGRDNHNNNDDSHGKSDGIGNGDSDSSGHSAGQTPAPELYRTQQQLVPLEQILQPQEQRPAGPGGGTAMAAD